MRELGVWLLGVVKMLLALSVLCSAALVSAGVVQTTPERKLADADFLKRQKQILDLFVGVGHSHHFKNELSDFDINANLGSWTDEKYPKKFMEVYRRGLLPDNAVFTMACHHTARDTIKLFDMLYFTKDLDTFIKVANWAKMHVNPGMFKFSLLSALIHREDTQWFVIPPLYEIIPNLYAPTATLHSVLDAKMIGMKEGRFNYNNTGYEFNYHSKMFGGVFGMDNRGHGEYRISYIREDVGMNTFFTKWMLKNPSWFCPEKYKKDHMNRRGENFYYLLQQIYARYTLERLANGLPFNKILTWDDPIEVGYNPNLIYLNGQSLLARPDNMIPEKSSHGRVLYHKQIERRLLDVVDAGMLWELSNKSLIHLNNEDGMELLGRLVYGTTDRPSRKLYPSLYHSGIDILAFLTNTGSDRGLIGNALSTPVTTLRDPVFYSYIARLLKLFQHYKTENLKPYTKDELLFNGVKIENIEVDKLLTYFDMFDYEVTNAVPMADPKEYTDHRYIARQYRLNHKPYRINVTVNSEVTGDAMVRIFLGPKFDSDEHLLTLEQARMAYMEIDRFPVQLTKGMNIWERSSTDSPVFIQDQPGFRSLYTSVNNALNQKEQFYISQGGRCGLPERYQLPMGWRGGRQYILSVVVTPYTPGTQSKDDMFSIDVSCGGSRLNDNKPLGFPFDRPIWDMELEHIPNILFKDVLIHHKDASDINRPTA